MLHISRLYVQRLIFRPDETNNIRPYLPFWQILFRQPDYSFVCWTSENCFFNSGFCVQFYSATTCSLDLNTPNVFLIRKSTTETSIRWCQKVVAKKKCINPKYLSNTAKSIRILCHSTQSNIYAQINLSTHLKTDTCTYIHSSVQLIYSVFC